MAAVQDLYRYKIISLDSSGQEPRPVAEHGMGVIYKAYDLLQEEIVALKVVRDIMLTKQAPKAKRAFLAEAMAGARLGKECPQIVKVYDIGQLGDILYMAEEWIPGGNIEGKCGNVSLFEARMIMLQIGNAVQTAHKHEIVHCDISPMNILHDNVRNMYRLSDFGLLKLMSSTALQIVGSSPLMTGGRHQYMPSDHWENPTKINFSTDVFAMAVTFFQLITGELPTRQGGKYDIPGRIPIKGEPGRDAPYRVNQLLDEFLIRRRDDNNINEFLSRVSAIPT